jgi:anti-sigma regulatory factor (Ser/Thr protein kinase)
MKLRMSLKSIQIDILNEADQARALLAVQDIAARIGFKTNTVATISTVVSELVRNILKYAGKGHVRFDPAHGNHGTGLKITVRDNGPGIADIEQALADHYSSSGTLGLGLPGVKRMVDEFEISSAPGKGTRVIVTKWVKPATPANVGDKYKIASRTHQENPYHRPKDRPAASPSISRNAAGVQPENDGGEGTDERTPEWGTWGRPCGGELVSGDTIIVKQLRNEIACAVVDVLGHGPDAHSLAKHVESFLSRRMSADPTATLHLLHNELRGTRGAVAGIAAFNPSTGTVRFVACGNIVARRMGETEVTLHSPDGTLGQSMRSPTEQKLVLQGKDVLLIHTDGIKSRFGIKDYPNIRYERPHVIAKKIVEKFGRSYDDATCLAMRYKF